MQWQQVNHDQTGFIVHLLHTSCYEDLARTNPEKLR